MDNEILAQIVQIKWLLLIFVVVVLLRVGFGTWWKVKSSGGFDAMLSARYGFPDRARALMDQGRHKELLALAQDRIGQFPGDALAYWYQATAAYRLGDRGGALASIRRVQDLQPDWVTTYVRPFIDELESHGLAAQPTAELRVVSPKMPANEDVPPPSIK